MLFESNGTIQKWHMANAPPEIEKYVTQKKCTLVKRNNF